MAFQLAEPVGHEVGARGGQSAAQVGKALRAEQQLADHEQRPAFPDDI